MNPESFSDQSKEKFRTSADPELDSAVEAAMEGVSMDSLVGDTAAEGRERLRGVLSGIVIVADDKTGEVLLIALDGKNQGMAPMEQFDPIPVNGDVVEAHVERFDEQLGMYKLSKKGAAAGNAEWDTMHVGQILEGTVTAVNKGGLELQFGTGMRGFMPSGQIDVAFHKDISIFLNQRMKAAVQKFDRRAKISSSAAARSSKASGRR